MKTNKYRNLDNFFRIIGVSRDNEEFVRTDRDDEASGKQIRNLDSLPTF